MRFRFPHKFVLGVGLIAISVFVLTKVFFVSGAQSSQSGQSSQKSSPKQLNDKQAVNQTVSGSFNEQDPNVIYLNAGPIDVNSSEGKIQRQPVKNFTGKQMRLVKFSGPIQPSWYALLINSGLQVVDYIPSYAYLVYGDFTAMSRVQTAGAQSQSPIQWDAEYGAAQRIDPMVYKRESQRRTQTGSLSQLSYYNVQLLKDAAANTTTMGLIGTLQTAPPKSADAYLHYVNVTAALTLEGVEQVAQQPDVISIQPYLEPVKLDERQNLIVSGNITGNSPTTGTNYMTWLASKGFTQSQFDASGFAVDVSDSGIDNGTTSPNHFGLYKSGDVTGVSRIIYNRLVGTANAGSTLQGCDGHGNLNTHIIGGFVPTGAPFDAFPFVDASGFRFGIGVNPFVKIGSSVIFDPGTFTSPNYENLQSMAYNNGVRISSNSWGSSSNTYTTDAQRYDALVRDAQPTGSTNATAGNQEMVIVFAAGNNGSGANTVGSPSTGKNVITVGASENVQAFGGADQCALADSGADSLNDIISFSSRGPTSDGRKKPDIVAPGTHVSGGVAQTAGQRAFPPAVANGSANSCFDASGVCAGPGGSNFFPTTQQWYTASSGTSHSTPAVAGGAALVRQHFINRSLTPPTPAMTKAVLMNGSRYLRGTGANDNFYSNNQGMGLMDLNRTLDSVTSGLLLRDQLAADKFTGSGQTRVFNVTATPNKLMRITLAWTDAPGATSGSAVKNNLNLSVVNGANTYLGNVFTGSFSVTGGAADALNNVESIYLPATASGSVAITVTGFNINSDAVPGDADPLDQDFALIVSEVDGSSLVSVVSNGATITADDCNSNGALDPGERVTVSFAIRNNGDGTVVNGVGTLQATGGVIAPTGPQTYGQITSGASVSQSFSFTVDGSIVCGNSVTASIQLQDGANNLGTLTFSLPVLGALNTTVFTENFDGVTAPALPAGWTTDRTGNTPPALFATTATTPDTPPNAVFTNGVTTVASNSLISPSIAIPAASGFAQLTFRQTRNFEGTATCFDGGILELSTDGGTTFNNVTSAAVGGSFVNGGYNGTVSSGFTNPLGGQGAWCFAQATYQTSTLNLPGTLSGQTIKLRWRAGWDSSTANANPNWRIDTIELKTATCTSCCPVITGTVGGGGNICNSGSANVTVSVSGGTGPYTVTLDNGGGTQTGAGPLFTFPVSPVANTTYSVATGSKDANGCPITGSGSATVTFNSTPPTPTITPGGPTTFCTGGSVTLTSSSATGNQWYLNGNPLGGATNQTYVATASGNYTVIVTTGGCASAPSALTTVTVNPIPPTPTITPGGPTTFCAGGSVTLTSSSATGNQWYLNGNPLGGATNQTYVATASGNYTVVVTTSGCPSAPSAPTTVTVNPTPPTPTITPGGPTTFCTGGSVTLTSSSATGNQWYLNGNPLGGATNQTYVATASGNYTVVVTASGCSSSPSAPTTVTVNPTPPTPTITPGGPTTFCAGGSVTLTSSSATGNQWYLNGNPIGGATSQTYVATASGNYTVVVTASGCASAPSAPTTVTVNPAPPTPTITPGGPTTFCAGGSVTLTSSSATGNQWYLNGNPIGGATNQTYVATASGNYTVVVTTSGCASAPSAPTTVTVNPTPPTPTITPGGPTTFCAGGSVTLTSSSATGNQWFLNGNPIGGATNQTYVATAAGNYTVVVTTSGCASAPSAPTTVTIGAVTITPASLPGGAVGTAYNQTVSATPAGSYNFTVSGGTLPGGLTLNPTTGAITGSPTTAGSFNFTITATSGVCSGSQSYTVVIVCPTITLPAIANATAGNAYSASVAASPAGTYAYSILTGNLPSGLTLNTSTGAITGSPTITGSYSFTIKASASGAGAGCNGQQAYTLVVGCPTITVSPASLPNGTTGTAYSQTLSVTPAGGNYSFAVTAGSLPTGLNLNPSTGLLSGTPTANGSSTFTVTATGFGGCTGSQAYTVVIGGGACPTITLPGSLPNGSVGTLYSNSVAASPADAYSYSVTAGSLPPGLTLFGSFGLIFGYPTAPGTYNFTITATLGSCTGSQAYSVVIGTGAVPAVLQEATVGKRYTQHFMPVGASSGVNFSVASGKLPEGITLTAAGALSGTPSEKGNFLFTLRAADAANTGLNQVVLKVNDVATPVVSGSIVDPLNCTRSGSAVNVSATVSNTSGAPQTATFTATLPAQLLALPGSCSTNVAGFNCSVTNASTVTATGTLANNQSVTITYQAQIADGVPAGAQVCVTSTASFAGAGSASVQACTTLNCPTIGVGSQYPSAALMSDQKAGSVLIYNIYTSATDPTRQNTRLSITNTDPARSISVHLFFVDGSSCSVADSYLCLTQNQTASFLASDLDPGTTGYVVAIATDANGCPTNFNFLIGDEYVKFSSGHAANLSAEAIAALPGGLVACNTNSTTAAINFDGISYNQVPRVLGVDNVGSRADGNDTLLILNRIGGNLATGASTLGTVFGILYDDSESGLSFSVTGSCQLRNSLSNTFPRTTPRFENFIPAGRSGWLKVFSQSDIGLSGSVINFNPNAGTTAGAFNQGHNLHILTGTAAMSYTIPVFPPGC